MIGEPEGSRTVAPWATSGDGSCPQGALVPWFGRTDVPCPWPEWEFCDGRETEHFGQTITMPDLRDFLDFPNWVQALNGQTVERRR